VRIAWKLCCLAFCGSALALSAGARGIDEPIRVASKNFIESYLLGEVVAQMLEGAGFQVTRRFGLGGTLICFEALVNNEIDVYVEYTGTLSQAILNKPDVTEITGINRLLADRSLRLLMPFGFDNTYAMAIKRSRAQALGLSNIGDLARHPDLKVVVSHEFLEREDGWPGMARVYGLTRAVTGIEHGLAYQAIEDGAIDVTDAYSTDGELKRYDLQVLDDDRQFFPQYLAAPLVRDNLPPGAYAALEKLAFTLDDSKMQALNARVVFEDQSFAEVANTFLAQAGLAAVRHDIGESFWKTLAVNTLQHLKLTSIALLGAVIVGIGASLLVFRKPVAARIVTYFCGLLQTIPSIALLALMIPVLGIGPTPAIVALFLYSLLPILRNTLTALTTMDPTLVRVAIAMGLSEREQLRYVYVPLALPSMLAGVRTAAVISIGTATLAAFIGAGGLGDPIVTGLALNDMGLILQGAVPAALLALVTELAFEGVERVVLPGHLRSRDYSVAR
jgi:osmoprotectant transport system permease protein